MVRLSDLSEHEQAHLLAKTVPPMTPPQWVSPSKPLSQMRVALITTAGLHFRDEAGFSFLDASFRPIPNEADGAKLVMSHSSVNFDRSGFADDVNLVFPIDRFRELEQRGQIGSLGDVHYSFMGAGHTPDAYKQGAEQVAGLLKKDKVDAVFLTPV